MPTGRAVLAVTSGPNEGDSVRLEVGSCRLVGRHLSESETVLIDRDGNRLLDGQAADIVTKHLKDKSPVGQKAGPAVSFNAFERGPDIIFTDDSISRAHAMIFFDKSGLGVIDLASTNGTFLNAARVGTALIKDGDVLTVGKSDMTVKLR
jgi:ABC transport system ATP-binding/permease protein